MPGDASLARLFREYGERWEVERVERSTEWVAVQRETGGDYIRIVGAHDLGALRYKMDQASGTSPKSARAIPPGSQSRGICPDHGISERGQDRQVNVQRDAGDPAHRSGRSA